MDRAMAVCLPPPHVRSIDYLLTISHSGSDGIILGPPRTNFSSTSRTAFGDSERNDKTPRDSEFRDRFQRGKMGAIGGDTESRGTRGATFRGRGDSDRDGEGWNTVQPRKSFGQEGAERFTGRMGGDHRHRDDRGLKERDENESVKDNRRRTFDNEGEEGDAPRRNGLTRGKTEPWFKENAAKAVDPAERAMNRERIEKAKSWRTHDTEDKPGHSRGDRNNERHDRRWDRERETRQEREPEWMDEPAEEKNAAHTEEEFRKFMERARGGPKPAEKAADAFEGPPGLPSFFTADTAAVKSAPAAEQRPDKFFAKFSETAVTTLGDEKPEVGNAPAAKSSKFAKLFGSSQPVETRGYTEPSTPAAGLPPATNGSGPGDAPASDADKQAFAALLSKLHLPPKQQSTPTPPNVNAYTQPPPPQPPPSQPQNAPQDPLRNLEQAFAQRNSLGSPDPPGLSYGLGRPEEPRLRSVPPPRPEIMAPRPMQPSTQPPTVRHDQMLHELVAARHNAQSQGSGRADMPTDQHSAYLMQLMQRRIPDQPARPIESIMRQPQPQRQVPMHHFEPEPNAFVREHGPAQQRQMRPPAGFEDQFRRSEGDGRMMQLQPQPPHILQRQQIPPGLDQGIPPQQLWSGQQPPPVQRQGPMIQPPMQQGGRAPPGLPFGGPVMGNNMPPNMLPSGDNIPGLPRGMPPPGFFPGGPPPPGPGFMPPPGMGGPFPGPDGFFPPGPFDGRGGMPPPGGAPFRR